MQMYPVESSNIARIGWDAESGLRIEFKPSGAAYTYPGVSFDVWNDFQESESKGKFFAANIKGKYEGVKG